MHPGFFKLKLCWTTVLLKTLMPILFVATSYTLLWRLISHFLVSCALTCSCNILFSFPGCLLLQRITQLIQSCLYYGGYQFSSSLESATACILIVYPSKSIPVFASSSYPFVVFMSSFLPAIVSLHRMFYPFISLFIMFMCYLTCLLLVVSWLCFDFIVYCHDCAFCQFYKLLTCFFALQLYLPKCRIACGFMYLCAHSIHSCHTRNMRINYYHHHVRVKQ